MSQKRRRGRELGTLALVVAASVVLVLTLVAGYARRALVDSDQFANRATAALRDDSPRTLAAERITDELVLANREDLLAARPLIASAASVVIGSRAFTTLFRSGVRDVHRALFGRGQDTVTLTVVDVGTVLAAVLARARPELARELEATGGVALLRRDVGELGARAARIADAVTLLAPALLLVAVALAVGALALSRDRRTAALRLGIGAAVAGVLLVVALGVGRSLAEGQVERPDAQAAVRAVWDAFLGDLRTGAWVLAGAGAVVAAAAASLLRPVDLGEPLRRLASRLATEPTRPALRALRGAGLVVAGVTVLLARDAVLSLALTALGVYLIYEGVSAVLRLVHRAPPPEDAAEPSAAGRPGRRRRLVPGLVAGALVIAAAAVFVAGGGTTTAAPPLGPCNGHRVLCDRGLDQVSLAATHNSMSVPLPGWYSAAHERPIADQLRDGVRGLLIDTHYADRLSNGRLRTDVGSPEQLHREARQDGVDEDAVNAALRIRERLGFRGEGERGMYLCHSFCELGGTRLETALDDLRDFLVANPGEVVVVVNQDYVTPGNFVAAVREAGLERFAYDGPVDAGRWPTLREMIDSGRRVVFLAENRAGGAPWYRLAYERITQETPYSFSRVAPLLDAAGIADTCRPNRGPAGAPLFLLNHWVTTDPVPKPSDAAKVNAYKALLGRARECGRVRGRPVNLVAVNFYRRGDVFRVVDELNGVDGE